MAMVGGAYLQDKNTCARTLTENIGGACMRRGVYMRDTMVLISDHDHDIASQLCSCERLKSRGMNTKKLSLYCKQ